MVEGEVVVVVVIWPEVIAHKSGRHSHLKKEREFFKQEREVIIIEVGEGHHITVVMVAVLLEQEELETPLP